MTPLPTAPPLAATIVIDYQNVHLTGWQLFMRHLDRHGCLLDPLLYAQQLLRVRNAKQQPGHLPAVLRQVVVYRGQHTDEHNPVMYAYTQASKAQWSRDPRVEINYRPLKYYYQYGADNRPLRDINGRKIYSRVQEKGVDVLVALRTVREVRNPYNGLVVIASTDSDLAPVLEEATAMRTPEGNRMAKIETVSWWSPNDRNQQLRCAGLSVWNTRLNKDDFEKSRDHTDYWTR